MLYNTKEVETDFLGLVAHKTCDLGAERNYIPLKLYLFLKNFVLHNIIRANPPMAA